MVLKRNLLLEKSIFTVHMGRDTELLNLVTLLRRWYWNGHRVLLRRWHWNYHPSAGEESLHGHCLGPLGTLQIGSIELWRYLEMSGHLMVILCDRLHIFATEVSWDRALWIRTVILGRWSWNGRTLGSDTWERLHSHCLLISWSWNVCLHGLVGKVSVLGAA